MSFEFEDCGQIILSDYRPVRILRVHFKYLSHIDHDEHYNTVKVYESSVLLDVDSNDFFTKFFKENKHIGLYDENLKIYRIFGKDGEKFKVKDQGGKFTVCA